MYKLEDDALVLMDVHVKGNGFFNVEESDRELRLMDVLETFPGYVSQIKEGLQEHGCGCVDLGNFEITFQLKDEVHDTTSLVFYLKQETLVDGPQDEIMFQKADLEDMSVFFMGWLKCLPGYRGRATSIIATFMDEMPQFGVFKLEELGITIKAE